MQTTSHVHWAFQMAALGCFLAATLAHAQDDTSAASTATLLFVQSAEEVVFDDAQGELTLKNVSPVVTFFTDRPKRTAGHVLLPAFLKIWGEGSDSFQKDPPNASLSVLEGNEIQTAVIELSNPDLRDDDLTYDVKILDGELPAAGGASSLFIDSLLGPIFSGGAGESGVRSGAIGALVGSMSGDAGEGALIGAGIGILGGAVHKDQKRRAAETEAATTRVVNVPNSNGSHTPVTLHLVQGGWEGPKGEVYTDLPSVDQLKKVYGM